MTVPMIEETATELQAPAITLTQAAAEKLLGIMEEKGMRDE